MSAIKSLFSTIFLFAILAGLGAGGYMLFQDTTGPTLTISPALDRVAPKRDLTLTVTDADSALRSVRITAHQEARSVIVVDQAFAPETSTQNVIFSLNSAGIKDGPFVLEVSATDASYGNFTKGNTTTQSYNMNMDSRRPRITTNTTPPYIRRGGSGVIAYTVSEDTEHTGIQVGDLFFPAYQQESGEFLCFFAFPYSMTTTDFLPELMAEDLAGNVTSTRLAHYPLDKQFKHDKIPLSDAFLNRKMPEFADIFEDDMGMDEMFIRVNCDLRQANVQALMDLSANTANTMMWQGAFGGLPRSANRAGFGDHRSYVYRDKVIDEQTHLGLDFASVAQAPIPAGNTGIIVFTGDMGIYGQLVVIDHGLGLMSLYSHMSEIDVHVGDMVNKGDIIGRTGATGMAAGDHLHFGILVGGIEVQPLEWLDGHWIQDNIYGRLKK